MSLAYYDRVDVVRRARFIGATWTSRDDATLRSLFPRAPIEDVLAALPGRTFAAIETRARRLRLTRHADRSPAWTTKEEQVLRRLFPIATWAELEAALPRRTRLAIDARGQRLGLRRPIRSQRRARHELLCQLHDARRAARISRDALADIIGVSKVQLQRWEQGWNVPRFRILLDWVQALGLQLRLEARP